MDARFRFAVFGNPVGHSRSPEIHHAFASQVGLDILYEKILVPETEFAEVVKQFFESDGKGANVTVPFKEEAYELCEVTSQRAKQAGAVNTLWHHNGKLHGDNTDGIGLVRDLADNLGWELQGKRVLILGAGGAVRGAIGPLQESKLAEIVIANRTVERAEELAEQFHQGGIPVYASGFGEIRGEFDLIINAVSAGLKGQMPRVPSGIFTQQGCAYDMVYGSHATPFMRWAEQEGAVAIADGLGMLVEQAAESFYLWNNRVPQTRPVIRQLRESI